MTQRGWMAWVLLAGFLLLYICPVHNQDMQQDQKIKNCFYKINGNRKNAFVVADNFYGILKAKKWNISDSENECIIFVKKSEPRKKDDPWPQMEEKNHSYVLYMSKWHTNRQSNMYVLHGNNTRSDFNRTDLNLDQNSSCNFTIHDPYRGCVKLDNVCEESIYDERFCKGISMNPNLTDKYIVNMTKSESNCINCDNPVKEPEEKVQLNVTLESTEGGKIDAAKAAEMVNDMSSFASTLNGTSVALSVGEGVSGILVKQTRVEDAEEISFGYASPNESINIIDDRRALTGFSRSVTVSKEAFQKAFVTNTSEPFAAVFRFLNMAQDEKNSTVLGDEVLAIEMGAEISNLTDTININFQNIQYKGAPSCHSWDGEDANKDSPVIYVQVYIPGSKPNWTNYGCVTNITGGNITCQCTHLTFFAILLTDTGGETISSSDLNNLNIITQVGCGLSMFFLGIVLFIYFLSRKKKASKSTRLLIHLVSSMFFLDFTFLINNYVANLNNSASCKAMAAVMHYFLLATFTWFAVQAFHLCLQLYKAGKIGIRRYILKVSVTSWTIPSVIVVVLLIVGKYGEQIIPVDNAENNATLCWIIDSDVHYVVNIGYYVVVFLFTFTTFIVIVSWLFCLKRNKSNAQMGQNGKGILTIMGLCCMLGITWGFAFAAYGVLRIPSYYIFTVLNSFQGFFLFIYYYNTSHSGEVNAGVSDQSHLNSTSSMSTSTLKTSLDSNENPYGNMSSQNSSYTG